MRKRQPNPWLRFNPILENLEKPSLAGIGRGVGSAAVRAWLPERAPNGEETGFLFVGQGRVETAECPADDHVGIEQCIQSIAGSVQPLHRTGERLAGARIRNRLPHLKRDELQRLQVCPLIIVGLNSLFD